MRLIDADELKEAMEEHTDYKGYLVCNPEEIIDLAPTIEERPRGKWIFDGVFRDGSNTIDGDMYHCSVCKRSIVTSITRVTDIFPFCHCGADMRKEGE